MRWLGLSAMLGAAGLLLAADPACLVAPPAELPQAAVLPPQIDRALSHPNPDLPLSDWPDVFTVRVKVIDPNATSLEWSIAIDGVQQPTDTNRALVNNGEADIAQSTAGFTGVDPATCHQILLTVTDVGVGDDHIGWTYSGSAWPYGCPISDASGVFPEGSATDTLSVPPNHDP